MLMLKKRCLSGLLDIDTVVLIVGDPEHPVLPFRAVCSIALVFFPESLAWYSSFLCFFFFWFCIFGRFFLLFFCFVFFFSLFSSY